MELLWRIGFSNSTPNLFVLSCANVTEVIELLILCLARRWFVLFSAGPAKSSRSSPHRNCLKSAQLYTRFATTQFCFIYCMHGTDTIKLPTIFDKAADKQLLSAKSIICVNDGWVKCCDSASVLLHNMHLHALGDIILFTLKLIHLCEFIVSSICYSFPNWFSSILQLYRVHKFIKSLFQLASFHQINKL